MSANTIDRLRETSPGWSVWVTGSLWVATRRGPVPDVPPGFFSLRGEPAATLIEDGPDELQAALREQDAIEDAVRAARAVDHDGPHPLNRSCPLGCLRLKVQTERALIAHCVFGGRYVPTIADLLTLRESGDLAHIPGIGRTRLTEIEDRLRTLTSGPS
ncbi:hypothetical protein [Actinocorallia aurantiaca]|uniref:RNA polymerase alpha subunit C-terminal domain-containing protein n=1 Tax=Actinocorallia aurantiaca TaxID=46204 RepID=A0ABP6GBK7_9ACTN